VSDASAIERRTLYPELRAVFPAACAALRPFFEPSNHWAGQSHEFLALRTLKEQFPSLSAQESFIVVATVKRLLAQGVYLENPDV
jgi:hypothetical protein